MKNSMWILLLVVVVGMTSVFKNSVAQASQSELTQAISQGAMLVDVRTPAEFVAGSVKAAINIPLDQLQQQIAKFKGQKSIIVFCRSGSRSSQAKAILEKNGITHILNGGSWMNVQHIMGK